MNDLRQYLGNDPTLFSLLPHGDALAFARLYRIVSQGLPFLLSDRESCLVGQSTSADPVWVWTSNDCPAETLEALIASLSGLRELGRLPGVVGKGKLIRLLALAFDADPSEMRRLNVYRMDTLRPFEAEGAFVPGSLVPPETAAELIALLAESDGQPLSPAVRREMGVAFSKSADTAAWRAPDGTIASIATCADIAGRLVDLHTVVTAEAYRNRGYAKALLTVLCRDALNSGRTPMLYADRDYPPSNAAYLAVGFSEAAHLYALRFPSK
ncbi:MAG: GNAT family N-acetyltransferase [Clostridia bacterium]|nr:GNAT family N-acetyltransferase [Clostridia bacterium]